MDLRLVRERLIEAERHVALSDKIIARQIDIVGKLEHAGHPTPCRLGVVRAERVGHRDLNGKELKMSTTADSSATRPSSQNVRGRGEPSQKPDPLP